MLTRERPDGERPDEQMKVVVQRAVAVEFERLPLFQFAERFQERFGGGLLAEHVLPIVSTVDDVVEQVRVDGAKRSRHSGKLSNRPNLAA